MKEEVFIPSDVRAAGEKLRSSRRNARLLRHNVLVADECNDERGVVYRQAAEQGLLTTYEFSGIKAAGASRNDAITNLLSATFQKMFELLRRNLGSRANFWPRPRHLRILDVDFYWKRARIALIITGPNFDDFRRGDNTKTRDSPRIAENYFLLRQDVAKPLEGGTVITIPYYDVWHNPSGVVEIVRNAVIESGKYPNLPTTR
jgi:hypothetical protein